MRAGVMRMFSGHGQGLRRHLGALLVLKLLALSLLWFLFFRQDDRAPSTMQVQQQLFSIPAGAHL